MFERISSNSIRLFSEKENGSLVICYPFPKEKVFIEREEYKKG